MKTQNEITRDDIKLALRLTATVAEAIRDAGTVPIGKLYAVVMGHLTLGQYQSIIDQLKNAGLVVESENHLLAWVGPRPRLAAGQQAAFPNGRWS